MTRVLRFVYSLAIAVFLVFAVILGTETVFNEPTFADYARTENRFLAVSQFEDAREDYLRNVSATAAAVGIAAVLVGAVQSRFIPVVPLGLMLGGLGAVMYGVAKWLSGPDELGALALFIIVAGGLILLVVAGYWLFGMHDSGKADRPTT